ncbi:uncharacterized protein EV420DRAFT_1084963 [Desarmillaria tabescens]|uniref:Uncharacterized protein n=1 Tax=Armillaria tabescens TaxID=1929756 RepID=A0AA39JFD9_ARMTA|nr:uncharacterized protein EV420DRAFT_1084963 [Desarmillaria tabescens]KAK0441756.1 hypothetical protein EV420DRAFT_1084963 [Desarmillaria tabescens]
MQRGGRGRARRRDKTGPPTMDNDSDDSALLGIDRVLEGTTNVPKITAVRPLPRPYSTWAYPAPPRHPGRLKFVHPSFFGQVNTNSSCTSLPDPAIVVRQFFIPIPGSPAPYQPLQWLYRPWVLTPPPFSTPWNMVVMSFSFPEPAVAVGPMPIAVWIHGLVCAVACQRPAFQVLSASIICLDDTYT